MANTIQHGVNITANDVKDLVESGTDAAGRKTWQDLYGSSALSYQAQNDALLKSYGDIIAEAYKSSLQQQNALYDIGLSANDTHDLRDIARQDMLAAYDSYLGQYQQAQQQIAEAYQAQKSTWDQALVDESTNFANLYNYAAQYYTDVLRGATWTGDDLDKPKFVEQGKEAVQDGYEQKTESLIDRYGLKWLTTTDKDGTVRQLTRDELMNKVFDTEGNITELGRNFYDMVFDMNLSDGYIDTEGNPVTTFDAWLSDMDSDLYTWAHSPDTFNYTRQGTKLGTAKTWAGLESDDGEFQAHQVIDSVLGKINSDMFTALSSIEGFDKEEFDKAQTDFDKTYQKIIDATNPHSLDAVHNLSLGVKSAKKMQEYVNQAISDVYTKTIDDLKLGLGENFGDYEDDLKTLYEKYIVKDFHALITEGFSAGNTQEERDANNIKQRKNYMNAYKSIKGSYSNFIKELKELIERAYSETKVTSVSGR